MYYYFYVFNLYISSVFSPPFSSSVSTCTSWLLPQHLPPLLIFFRCLSFQLISFLVTASLKVPPVWFVFPEFSVPVLPKIFLWVFYDATTALCLVNKFVTFEVWAPYSFLPAAWVKMFADPNISHCSSQSCVKAFILISCLNIFVKLKG